MWQRFTEMARKVVFYAQEEAQKCEYSYVGTEHMLLGLLREPESTAGRALLLLGGKARQIREEVERQLARNQARPSTDMTLTPQAKRVIDLAYEEARALSNNYIGTEHLLLGLIREEKGIAGRVLSKFEIDIGAAREVVRTLQSEEDSASKDPEPPVSRSSDQTATLTSLLKRTIEDSSAQGLRFFGTRQVILALTSDPNCVAMRAMVLCGKSREELHGLVHESEVSFGLTTSSLASPMVDYARTDARRIAREMKHSQTETGHLLLAMMGIKGSFAAHLMQQLDLPYEQVWLAVAQIGESED